MKKERLMMALDVALAVVVLRLVWNLDMPNTYESNTLRMFWNMRSSVFRTAASALWLAATWLGMYRSWDGAKRIDRWVLLGGMALLLSALTLPYVTQMIVWHKRMRLLQELYGALMLFMTAAGYGTQLALERANADTPECVGPSRRYRRALAMAFAVQAAGLVVSMTLLRQATWYAAAIADACVFVWWLLERDRENP